MTGETKTLTLPKVPSEHMLRSKVFDVYCDMGNVVENARDLVNVAGRDDLERVAYLLESIIATAKSVLADVEGALK